MKAILPHGEMHLGGLRTISVQYMVMWQSCGPLATCANVKLARANWPRSCHSWRRVWNSWSQSLDWDPTTSQWMCGALITLERAEDFLKKAWLVKITHLRSGMLAIEGSVVDNAPAQNFNGALYFLCSGHWANRAKEKKFPRCRSIHYARVRSQVSNLCWLASLFSNLICLNF